MDLADGPRRMNRDVYERQYFYKEVRDSIAVRNWPQLASELRDAAESIGLQAIHQVRLAICCAFILCLCAFHIMSS